MITKVARVGVGRQIWFWDRPHIKSGTIMFESEETLLVKIGDKVHVQLDRWMGQDVTKTTERVLSLFAFESFQRAADIVVAWFEQQVVDARQSADQVRDFLGVV